MALINQIRDRSALVLTVVGVGIVLFLFSDMIGFNPVLFGQERPNLGVINGHEITQQEFDQEVDFLAYQYTLNNQENPKPEQMDQFREQAWGRLIYKYAYKPQIEEAGMTVTPKELIEMVQGENVHQAIKSAFRNQETGEFDRNLLMNYLSNVARDPKQKAIWQNFEQSLPDERLLNKYTNALSKSYYVTTAEAKKQHLEETGSVKIDYLYVPFHSVPDSTLEVSDEEMMAYYEEHKSEYKADGKTAALDFVSFSIAPSKEDSLAVLEQMKSLVDPFKTTKDDSAFANTNSDVETAVEMRNPSNLYKTLNDNVKSLSVGEVYGPFANEQGQYELYKVVDTAKGEAVFARASHILFQIDKKDPSSESKAKANAQRVLGIIQAGDSSFATMAKKYGTDGTASKGGDLGWFGKGRMVAEFENAVFNTKSPKLLSSLVKTQFGYHIIEVTAAPTNQQYKIATVIREIDAGESTREIMYQKASEFAGISQDADAFKENAEMNNYKIQEATGVKPGQKFLNQIQDLGDVTRWAFTDGQTGEVSPVFENNDYFIVALLKNRTYKNESNFVAAKEEIKDKVIKQKQGDEILAKLGAASEDLEALKAKFEETAVVYKDKDIKLQANSFAGIGFDPALAGRAFGQKVNSVSEPFRSQSGIVVLIVKDKTLPSPVADYSTYRQKKSQTVTARSQYNATEAIKELSEIEDNRFKFY